MKTVTLTIGITFAGQNFDMEFETGNDIEEAVLEFINEQFADDEDIEEVTDIKDAPWEVTDWSDVQEFDNLQDIDTLNEIADTKDMDSYDWEVISAGIEADIDIDNIAEAYAGAYRDDEDFAEETADSLGYINKDVSWPYNCIDWEQAANELMQDYREANGHYFRL
jgi:hypothetical protein